jgi:hypothetical protein
VEDAAAAVRAALLAAAAAAAGRGPRPLLTLLLAARRAACAAGLGPLGEAFTSELLHRAAAHEAAATLAPGEAAVLLLAAAELAGLAPEQGDGAAGGGQWPLCDSLGASERAWVAHRRRALVSPQLPPAPAPPPLWLCAAVGRVAALAARGSWAVPDPDPLTRDEALGLAAGLRAWLPRMDGGWEAAARASRGGGSPRLPRGWGPRGGRGGGRSGALAAAARGPVAAQRWLLAPVAEWLVASLRRCVDAGTVSEWETECVMEELAGAGL